MSFYLFNYYLKYLLKLYLLN